MIRVWHDPNDCCFNKDCGLCHGLIWGVTDEADPVSVGDEVQINIWGEPPDIPAKVVTVDGNTFGCELIEENDENSSKH